MQEALRFSAAAPVPVPVGPAHEANAGTAGAPVASLPPVRVADDAPEAERTAAEVSATSRLPPPVQAPAAPAFNAEIIAGALEEKGLVLVETRYPATVVAETQAAPAPAPRRSRRAPPKAQAEEPLVQVETRN